MIFKKPDEIMYSMLGYKIYSGDVKALKYLYGNVWRESPPNLRIISLLQQNITAGDILKAEKYSTEFYYYWGMLNLGEQSRLVFKDIDIAENCFNKIRSNVPCVDARLAYIGLLNSTELAHSEENVERIDKLRQCAGRQDIFSQIAIARIVFYQFIDECEKDEEVLELPLKVWQYLERPCFLGHPVAILLWNEMLTYIGTSRVLKQRQKIIRPNVDILYDYNFMQICK